MIADEIQQIIKAQIDSGKLGVNTKCPSEHQLCQQFSVSRGTVRKALKRLAQQGYLEVAQGRQRIVSLPDPSPPPPLRLQPGKPLPLSKLRNGAPDESPSFGEYLNRLGKGSGWEPSDDVLKGPAKVACSDLRNIARFDATEIADKLRLKARDKVIWFLRRRSGKDAPLVMQWVVVPTRTIRSVAYDDLCPGGLTKLYQEKNGIKRAFAEAHYRATLASGQEARDLRVERDSPLIEERRVSFYIPPNSKRRSDTELLPYEYLLSLYSDRISLDFSWHDR